jgi:hypothetical protein
MTKERKGFAANERNGQSWWLANKRERKKKKKTWRASPTFFILFLILLCGIELNRFLSSVV